MVISKKNYILFFNKFQTFTNVTSNFVFYGIASGLETIVSHAYGAEKFELCSKLFWKTVVLNVNFFYIIFI